MFAGAGALTVAAAVALWQSIDAYRWRDWRRFWIATVLVPLLSTVVYASIWEGSRHPTFNFWDNLWLAQIGYAKIQVAQEELSVRAGPARR